MKRVSPMHQALGRAVRLRRQETGVSQEELGADCRIDRTYVGGIERGEP